MIINFALFCNVIIDFCTVWSVQEPIQVQFSIHLQSSEKTNWKIPNISLCINIFDSHS